MTRLHEMTPTPPSRSPHDARPLNELLRQLDPGQARVANAVYALPPLRMGERVLIWQSTPPFRSTDEVHCRTAEGTVRISVERFSSFDSRFDGIEALAPPASGLLMAVEALSPVLGLLENLMRRSLVCTSIHPAILARPDEYALGFFLTDLAGQLVTSGQVVAPTHLWEAASFHRSSPGSLDRLRSLPLSVALRLGECRLSWKAMRGLQVGDGLRFASRSVRAGTQSPMALHALLRGEQYGFRAHVSGHELVVDTPFCHFMNPIQSPSSSPTSAAPSQELHPIADAVEASLTFELATLSMTLSELARLRPGQVVQTGKRLRDEPVRILTSGRMIARGELAAIGDELVVVVTQTADLPLL